MEFSSNGKGNLGVTLGAIGTGLGVLGGSNILGGLFGGGNPDQMPITKYEAAQQAKIAALEDEIKFRDSSIYTDGKILEVYRYFDGENREIREKLCRQEVHNQQVADAFEMLKCDIKRERDERCYADNAVVNYVNGTFVPKLVADYTAGTTTTAQALYNPLPSCGCCK